MLSFSFNLGQGQKKKIDMNTFREKKKMYHSIEMDFKTERGISWPLHLKISSREIFLCYILLMTILNLDNKNILPPALSRFLFIVIVRNSCNSKKQKLSAILLY